jgi:hypothetical protein
MILVALIASFLRRGFAIDDDDPLINSHISLNHQEMHKGGPGWSGSTLIDIRNLSCRPQGIRLASRPFSL